MGIFDCWRKRRSTVKWAFQKLHAFVRCVRPESFENVCHNFGSNAYPFGSSRSGFAILIDVPLLSWSLFSSRYPFSGRADFVEGMDLSRRCAMRWGSWKWSVCLFVHMLANGPLHVSSLSLTLSGICWSGTILVWYSICSFDNVEARAPSIGN